jgi:RNA polymerase sigma-70 factor (ECF subfamily)
MSSANHQDVTMLLREASAGGTDAPGRLLELVYADLRRLASAYMKNERSDHTLQATALVHEAFIRLVDWENVTWQNRAHFFAVAAEVMRKILIDHARKKGSAKRGGPKLALDEAVSYPDEKEFDILALEDALQNLERLDPRKAKIVELRFFGGLSIEETAHVLDVSMTTVKREWTFARAWFQRELKKT